jgi:hypothetical protein
MSDSNRLQISLTEEGTWGVTPNTAFDEIPVTGGGMNLETETLRSGAIRSDGQRAGSARINATPAMTIEYEFVNDTFDELLARSIRNATGLSTAAAISASDIDSVATGNKFTGTSGMNTNVAVGQWVKVAGFVGANNNGWFKVVSASATEIAVVGTGITNETPGTPITIKGAYVRNGSDSPSYTIQQEHLDETNLFEVITGARISSMGVEVASRSMITGSASFTGKDFDATATSKAGDGTVNAAATSAAMAEVDSFDGLYVDGVKISAYELLSAGMTFNTPTREQTGLGSTAKIGVPLGNLEAVGTVEVYKEDGSWNLLTKYAAFTAFGLAFSLVDAAGNSYLFEFPKVHLSNESAGHPGPDADTLLSFTFEAEPDDTLAKTVQICKVDA